LKEWNATELAFPASSTIHQLFEEQAARTPDAVAVIDGMRRVSYRELNTQANHVARVLLERGIGVEDIVGVHLSRSVDMVSALLGVLKAGAAYLPLDQQYPEVRLHGMLEDSGCRLVLTDVRDHKWPLAVRAVPTTSGIPGAADPNDANPDIAVSANNLAYVIYTSGSTGRPKGVAIEHHSTVSFLTWGKQAFTPHVLRGTLAATPISFDLSVFEVFLPLLPAMSSNYRNCRP
jgi:non-ribosomal peptide synthetase component F